MSFTPEERSRCRIVGTPIGNLADITPRAVQALREADIIYAEDTRTAKALLHHLEISKPLKSYHKDNENQAAGVVIAELLSGKRIALISEAGMPGISDPGFLLIRELIAEKIPYEVIPGVSAGVHAAVASGLCDDGRYLFYGFLPHKGAAKVAENLSSLPYPIVFYESPYRVKDTLEVLLKYFSAPVAVCRELTKMYEEITHIYTKEDIENITVKGEFCLVVRGENKTDRKDALSVDVEALADILAGEKLPAKSITNVLKALGIKKNAAYETAMESVNRFEDK